MNEKKAFIRGLAKRFTQKGMTKSFRKGIQSTSGKALSEADLKKVYRGFKEQASKGDSGSLIGEALGWAAGKVVGKPAVERAKWKISKPLMRADMAVGRQLAKVPLAGGLFKVKDKVKVGPDLYREVKRTSALGPLAKARGIAEPLMVGIGTERALEKVLKSREQKNTAPGMNKSAFTEKLADHEFREKVASTMIQLHEDNKGHQKRARAIRLIYKQAEMGLCDVPHSYSEFQEKVASLINQDLAVFEKALEIRHSDTGFGEVGEAYDPYAAAPEQKFQASLIGSDLF